MTRTCLFLLLSALLTLVNASASAQKPASPTINWKAIETAQRQPGVPVPAPSVQAEMDAYTISSLHHRAQTFAWQLTSSKVIFWMVVGLVLAGVTFSAIQFGVALRRKSDISEGEIALNLEGVKIRSQFLGVITLALSLAFFYLYLKTVYPISELKQDTPQAVRPGS